MIVQTIESGALVLAKRSTCVDTCVIIRYYTGLVSSDVMYYYAWSMTDQAFVIIYDVDIIGVIDNDFGMSIEFTYPSDQNSEFSYAANGFRWRVISTLKPDDADSDEVVAISGSYNADVLDE